MFLTASVLLSVALTLQPDSGLRIVNPHPIAVDATLNCGDRARAFQLQPYAIVDFNVDALCATPTLDATLALLSFETRGETEQRVLTTDESCAPMTMSAPLFACERGVATASVPAIEGATYAWTAEGATIAEGANTPRVQVNLGDGASAKLVCVVNRAGCLTDAIGIIAIRKPLLIHELKVPSEIEAAQPLTISWSFEPGAAPSTQLLTGDAFAAPVELPGDQRSYTFTPATSGTRNVELLASYATSLRPADVPRGRRRAVGSTLATATQCPSARAVKQVEIRGCSLGTPEIEAPDDVEAGSSFLASVAVQPGDSVSWSVKNGTLLTPDYFSQIEVRANDLEIPVDLSVVVTRSFSCAGTASTSLTVRPRAVCASNPPTVALSVVAQSCNTATIQATFTGTPPFRGVWFDSTPFETSNASITHEVTSPGTYSIFNFRDAICSGVVTATARVVSLKPTVKLSTVGGNCSAPTTKLVATFTGTPPFRGTWGDGQPFTTNEYKLERAAPAARSWWIQLFYDAICNTGGGEMSNNIDVYAPPRATIADKTECQYGANALAYLKVDFYDGMPPYTVQWADGVTTTSGYAGFLIRTVNTSLPLAEYQMIHASTGLCGEATILNSIARVALRPPPVIDRDATDIVICKTNIGNSRLAAPLVGNPTIAWSMTGGAILSGQGTSEITFQADPAWPTDPLLEVRTTHVDGACDSYDGTPIFVMGDPLITNFKMSPSTIKAGGTSELTYTWERDVDGLSFDVSDAANPADKSRYDDLLQTGFSCNGYACRITYRDTHGPGVVAIKMTYGGPCDYSGKELTVMLTIEP